MRFIKCEVKPIAVSTAESTMVSGAEQMREIKNNKQSSGSGGSRKNKSNFLDLSRRKVPLDSTIDGRQERLPSLGMGISQAFDSNLNLSFSHTSNPLHAAGLCMAAALASDAAINNTSSIPAPAPPVTGQIMNDMAMGY